MPKIKCSVNGCATEIVARGLCDLHYRRLLHHEDLEHGRPKDWGARENHPLYSTWATLRRRKTRVATEWKDFWKFVGDVGERPSKWHCVHKVNDDEPIGPKNFFWKEKVVKKRKTESQKEYWARFQRSYRKLYPERVRNTVLRKSYGIGLDEYDRMLEDQHGVCAICSQEERAARRITRLAVDHCHDTGRIRGLLCAKCNRAIGGLNHDVALLKKAIVYLEKHL